MTLRHAEEPNSRLGPDAASRCGLCWQPWPCAAAKEAGESEGRRLIPNGVWVAVPLGTQVVWVYQFSGANVELWLSLDAPPYAKLLAEPPPK